VEFPSGQSNLRSGTVTIMAANVRKAPVDSTADYALKSPTRGIARTGRDTLFSVTRTRSAVLMGRQPTVLPAAIATGAHDRWSDVRFWRYDWFYFTV
jgi:hypothetical protein